MSKPNASILHLMYSNHQKIKPLPRISAQHVLFLLQNQALKNEINALKAALNNNKGQSSGQVRDLEERLKECQEQLMAKIKDFNSARDAQASLRAEIDQYRQLLNVGKQA